LDYTDGELNRGSKLFVAVSGEPRRRLAELLPESLPVRNPRLALPGVLCAEEITVPLAGADGMFPDTIPLIVLVDDSMEAALSLRNFLWTTFTKSDPACDVYGVGEFIDRKHWGCTGALVIDARRKPHHALELEELSEVSERADRTVERILR
jgi:4-hydroxy-3-polyprenylbenzoate decarboxylase